MRTLVRTLDDMADELDDEVREASTDLAARMLRHINTAASGPRERPAAAILKVYRDRIPKVGFDASTRVSVSGKPRIGEFFYGVEFGGGARPTTQQFGPYDRNGRFVFPTVKRRGESLADDWWDHMLDSIDDEWRDGVRRSRQGSAP